MESVDEFSTHKPHFQSIVAQILVQFFQSDQSIWLCIIFLYPVEVFFSKIICFSFKLKLL